MVETKGAAIARVARGWIGTPFHHRAAAKGVGCDCLGLVLGVWQELGGGDGVRLPAYAPDWFGVPKGELLLGGLGAHLAPLGGIAPAEGDVVALRLQDGGPVQHAGILTNAGETFVHAYARRGVVESRLSRHWQSRVAAAFRMPIERV